MGLDIKRCWLLPEIACGTHMRRSDLGACAMSDFSNLGRLLVFLGLGLAVVGALLWGLSRTNLPIGRLPGDFRFELGNVSCFAPLATMVIVSLVLTLVLNVILRLLNK